MRFKELFDENLSPIWEKIEVIPEFAKLKETKQNTLWHREGTAWVHTALCVVEMKNQMSFTILTKEDHLMMMASALCHDLGKGEVTYYDETDNNWHCKHHGEAGEKIVRRLFFDEEVELREKVCAMVRNHMKMHQLVRKEKEDEVVNPLIKLSYCGVSIHQLLTLYICDSVGAHNSEDEDYIYGRATWIKKIAEKNNMFYLPYPFLSFLGKYEFFTNYIVKPKTFTMYLTIGIPGSGKDTWCKYNLKHVVKISRDEIRKELGIDGEKPMGTKEQENKVTQIARQRILDCCSKRQSFVICDTNIHKRYREEYTKLVMEYEPNIEYIYIDTPIEVCKKRREGMMPLEVIDRMFKQLDFPTLAECNELKIVKGTENYEFGKS